MSVEQELIEATGFNPRKPHKARQDHLGALLRAVDELDDDDFKALSDDATGWVEKAVAAYKAETEIPDFEDSEEAESDNEAVEAAEDAEVEEASGDPTEDDVNDDAEEEPDPSDDELTPEEDSTPPVLRTKKNGKAPEPKAKVKKAKKAEPEPEKEPEEEPTKKAEPKVLKGRIPTAEDIVLDRYGTMEQTKTHQALMMLEKGCTMQDIRAKLKDTFYNLVRRMAKEGHHVEKEGTFIKLTHKDDYGAKAKGKKK